MSTDFSKLNLVKLKAELKQRNLPLDGKKTEMVARIEKYEKELAEKASEEQIIEEIEKITDEDEQENGTDDVEVKEETNEETKDEEAAEEEEMEHDGEEKDGEEKTEEDKDGDDKEGDDKDGDDKDDDEEDKKEEKKEVKKDTGPDYTKNATGFVLALDSGRKIVVPTREIIKADLLSNIQPKTVLVHPISIEDLAECTFHSFFEACVHFQVTFQQHSNETPKSTKGYIEFMWASVEQATEQAELLSQIREDLNIKHLAVSDKKADVLQELPKEVINYDTLMKKILYIGNLPPTATDQALHALFPDATRLAVIHNEDGLPKGYALAEMPSEEACERAVKMYMNVEFEEYTLVVMKSWPKPPKGILDNDTRNDLLGKVKKCRVRLRSKVPVDQFTRRKLDNEMTLLKQRLDKDCKAREELALCVPPDVVRREELLKELEEKRKEETSDTKTTPQKKTFSRTSNSVPYKRPVGQNMRGRRGAPGMIRGSRSGGYGNQGYGNQGYGTQSYSNQGSYGGSGTGEYGQAVEMLMQVSKMLGRGQSASGSSSQGGYDNYSTSSGGGYGSSGYGGTGYGNTGYGNTSGGYGYGSGMLRGKRQADDDGFGGGKRGPGYKGQRRW